MTHDEIWHLLPWFINGRLRADVLSDVDAHLAGCAQCRAEVAQQKQVSHALLNEEPRSTSAQDSFNQLWSRIRADDAPGLDDDLAELDEGDEDVFTRSASPAYLPANSLAPAAPTAPAARESVHRPGRIVQWLAAAVILEAVGLGTLALNGMNTSRAPAVYQTLSAPAAPRGAPSIRAVFASDVTLRDLQNLLSRLQLRIVDGPTEAGVYTLAVDSSRRSVEATLADLRGNMFVRFAEPIGAGLAKQ